MKIKTLSFIAYLILLVKINSLSFQDNIFQKLIENKKGENIMISPLSLYQALSLLANGASGETQKEILKVLYPEQNIDNNILNLLNSNIEQIFSIIESENSEKNNEMMYLEGGEDSKIKFNNVNGIFSKKGVELTNQFTQICENYNTSFFELISAEQVNNFCSENTNGKINHIINEINEDLVLMLINVIYFKGTWLEKFKQQDTKNRAFLNYDNSIVKVNTMYQKYYSNLYYEDEKVQIISLPYISNKLGFKMIIILPNIKKYSSPLDYLKKEKINFSDIYSKLESRNNIHLYLPKFNYKYEENLKDILEDLGMKLAFDENSSNFENLCQNIETYVNSIFHSTYIDVNENGTEAAAVTAQIMYPTAVHKDEYYMYVNHSFIYMIQSEIKDANNNYLMPFIGTVNKLEEMENDNKGDKNNDNEDKEDTSKDTDEEPSKISPINNGNISKISLTIFISLILFIFC